MRWVILFCRVKDQLVDFISVCIVNGNVKLNENLKISSNKIIYFKPFEPCAMTGGGGRVKESGLFTSSSDESL